MNAEQLEPYAKILEALHAVWTPHAAQIKPGQDLFYKNKKRLVLRFGRQTGKSQFCAYAAVRWALTKPGAQVFVIGPFLTQTRAIYLHSGLIEQMCPPNTLAGTPHIADGRYTFLNGSQIKIMAAENYEGIRGLTADLVICDEIKQFRDEAWPVIHPTLLAKRAPLILAGTPPGEPEHMYWTLMKEAQSDPETGYYIATTYDNPYVDAKDIDKERARYEARGDSSTWKREYLAEYAVDERRAIFPMFDKKVHVRPYAELRHEVLSRQRHWDFVVAMDPASASTFGVLIGAVNRSDGRVRLLDELYVQDQAMTSVGAIWPEIKKKMNEIVELDERDGQDWTLVCDEAAAGVRTELQDIGVYTIPTQKHLHKKSTSISLIKDLYLSRKQLLSDRCVHLVSEIENYFLNAKGEYVKEDDHLIDANRYLLHAAHYSHQPEAPPPDPYDIPPDERRRAFTPSEDFAMLNGSGIPTYSFETLDDDY